MKPSPLNGRKAVTALLIGGAIGAFLAVVFHVVARNTPLNVNPRTFFWHLILLTSFGGLAAMGLEAVRQLQEQNPEAEYRRQRRP